MIDRERAREMAERLEKLATGLGDMDFVDHDKSQLSQIRWWASAEANEIAALLRTVGEQDTVDGVIERIEKKHGGLFMLDKREWEIKIHHTITEPTMPTVTIGPEKYKGEGWHELKVRFDESLILDGVLAAEKYLDDLVASGKIPESPGVFMIAAAEREGGE